MQTRTGLAGGNLRGEGHVQVGAEGQVADHPLGNHQLVGGVEHGNGQELNLVLLIHHTVLLKVAHLAVAVLDLATSLGDVVHAALAEVVGLGIGHRLVIAVLVAGGVEVHRRADNVILQLTHGLVLHAGHLAEGLGGLAQRLLGRTLQRVAVLVKEGAQQAQRGNLGKRIKEGGAEPGQHIQVT